MTPLGAPFGACLAAALWLGAAATGMRMLVGHEFRPGTAASAPKSWPASSRIPRAPNLPTLLLFGHPRCPCTRATIGELAILMAHVQGRVDAHVLFIGSDRHPRSWSKTDLWSAAERIPGVTVSMDAAGSEVGLFHSRTSGQTLLYGSNGLLVFEGGITGSRGHSGDNAGRGALVSLLLDGRANSKSTFVFGCPLQDSRDDGSRRPAKPWKI